MSGIAERLAEVLAVHLHRGTSGRLIGTPGITVDDFAQALLPVVEREIAAARGEVVARVEAVADGWAAIPPYLASDYDRGRVDQREMCETELRAALSSDPDRGEGEGK